MTESFGIKKDKMHNSIVAFFLSALNFLLYCLNSLGVIASPKIL